MTDSGLFCCRKKFHKCPNRETLFCVYKMTQTLSINQSNKSITDSKLLNNFWSIGRGKIKVK